MTVSVSGPLFYDSTGDGSTTVFGFNDEVLSSADLVVQIIAADGTVTNQTLGVDYTVAVESDFSGATITMITAPIVGVTLRRFRKSVATQSNDLTNTVDQRAENTERQLDRLTHLAQESQAELGRAWKSDYGTTGGLIETLAEGHFPMFDANGNMVDGGNADDINQAQGYAAAAETAKAAAETAQAAAEDAAEDAENVLAGAAMTANNLDDLADADTALDNLGGTTTGKALFKAANAYTARAVTEPSIILSQVDAAGINAKWTAALAVINSAGGGEIIIDGNADIATALANITSSHPNLKVRGSHRGVKLTATASIAHIMRANGASNVNIEDLIFAVDGNAGIGFRGEGDNLRLQGVEGYGADVNDTAYIFDLQGNNVSIDDYYVYNAAQGIRFSAKASSVATENLFIGRGRYYNLKQRALNIAGVSGGGAITNVLVNSPHFEGLTWDCQPCRVDAALSDISGVQLLNGTVEQALTSDKADDSCSLHKVSSFLVSGWVIDRYTDVGINASNGCSDGLITGNNAKNAKWAYSVGIQADRGNSLPNSNVHILGNHAQDWLEYATALYSTDNCSSMNNTGTTTTGGAALDYYSALGTVADNPGIIGVPQFNHNTPSVACTFKDRPASGYREIVKLTDETKTSDTTLSADDDLSFYGAADEKYAYRLELRLNSPAAADLNRKFTLPSGASAVYAVPQAAFSPSTEFNAATAFSLNTTGSDQFYREEGMITMSSTAGTVSFDWAQNTSDAGNTSILEGSKLTIEKIA